MKIQIPTADLKSALASALSGALTAEQQLAGEAKAEVQRLIDDLYPLVVDEVQAMLAAKDPAVPKTYLAVLQGCVDATVAKLGLRALESQRQILASALQTGIQILALLLKAAIVAA